MKVEFKYIDGEIFVEVYQVIWDEEILIHRENVSEKLLNISDEE